MINNLTMDELKCKEVRVHDKSYIGLNLPVTKVETEHDSNGQVK